MEILTSNYINKVKDASNKISSIVGSTLGPGGRTVLVHNKNETRLSKDGVYIARSIKSSDLLESAIFKLIKESAEKTNTTCGDGTTSTTIFCNAFIEEIFNIFSNKSLHFDKIYKDIEKCLEFIYGDLEKQSKHIETEEEIGKIAYLASNGDKELSDLVKRTLTQIGVDGVLSIKESKSFQSSIELTDGYSFNAGYASLEFVNAPKEFKFIANDCIVLMYQGRLSQTKEVETLMGKLYSDGRPILIVAEEFEEQLLSVILFNNANPKNTSKVCCIVAPYYGHKKIEAIKDLSMIVGGKPLNSVTDPLSNFSPEVHLGHTKNVVAGKQKTIFIGNNGDSDSLNSYIEYLKECLKGAEDEQEESEYTFRINQLSSSSVTIYLGANTPAELNEKKHRLEDALEASTVALRGGVLPGCCAALLRAISNLVTNWKNLGLNHPMIVYNIENILKSSFEVLIQNMNYSSSDIKNKILNSKEDETYDLRTNSIVNAYDSSVIEPLYVVLQSIKNSYSLAKVLTQSTSGLLGD